MRWSNGQAGQIGQFAMLMGAHFRLLGLAPPHTFRRRYGSIIAFVRAGIP